MRTSRRGQSLGDQTFVTSRSAKNGAFDVDHRAVRVEIDGGTHHRNMCRKGGLERVVVLAVIDASNPN